MRHAVTFLFSSPTTLEPKSSLLALLFVFWRHHRSRTSRHDSESNGEHLVGDGLKGGDFGDCNSLQGDAFVAILCSDAFVNALLFSELIEICNCGLLLVADVFGWVGDEKFVLWCICFCSKFGIPVTHTFDSSLCSESCISWELVPEKTSRLPSPSLSSSMSFCIMARNFWILCIEAMHSCLCWWCSEARSRWGAHWESVAAEFVECGEVQVLVIAGMRNDGESQLWLKMCSSVVQNCVEWECEGSERVLWRIFWRLSNVGQDIWFLETRAKSMSQWLYWKWTVQDPEDSFSERYIEVFLKRPLQRTNAKKRGA